MSSPYRAGYRVRAGWWLKTAHIGWREYIASTPLRVNAMTLLPRAVLQTVFIVLLSNLTGGGQSPRYALVGATALTITLSTMVGIADVPSTDKWSGTFWRIRTGHLAPFTVFVLRSWPYPFIGVCTAVTTLLVLAPFDPAATIGHLGVLLPCFVLLALTTSCAGLAGAAFAVGRRADVLIGNLLAYLTMLCSGAVIPPGRNTLIDAMGTVVPMRHGLAAVHAMEAGRPAVGELVTEAAIGAAWFVIAWTLVVLQVRRARASGHDEYV